MFATNSTMAEGQIKSKGQKLAVGCHHTAYEWDHHCFCVSCREKNKGDDVCVTSKEEDCFVCLQFTAEQRKKLKAKKAYEKKKISKEAISKEVEDSLLGADDIQPSQASANKKKSSNVPSTSNSSSISNDPLQLILARLETMQGRLHVLETKPTEVTTQEVYGESAGRDESVSRSVFATTEDDDHGVGNDQTEQRTHHKRARSQSPHSDHRLSSKDEEVEEDPSYRQFLASITGLLDLSTPEKFKEVPSKIFGSKDRKKKQAVLPMCLPPVDEINSRWIELEKKVAGNPSENGERLHSAPFNTDTFLPYTRPNMKFYRSTISEFSISAPKCQDSFKSICSKSSSAPSYISVPTRQFTTMESVKREHVQVLGFVSHFIRALEKCASNMEDILQAGVVNMEDSFSKDIEELLSYIQMQYSTIASIERALETVFEASMTMSCNMQLARRDMVLKYSASHLHEHDRNRLRSGFTSTDLFSPSVLNNVENVDRPKDRKWIPNPFSIQGKEGLITILLHFQIHLQRILFMVNRTASHNSNPHNPPEGEVMVEEGNDYIKEVDLSPGGRLQLFHKVWLENTCHPRVAHILKYGSTVVAYLNKQGGTHSLEMCLMIWRLMAYCHPRAILLRARHIQGCLNVIADSLSCRGACFWKSHTTFTNFYLKDVSWKSKEGSEYSLGSVVSAQHIVKL